MRVRTAAFLALVAVIAVVLVGGASARGVSTTSAASLSTDSGVARYLVSLGINPKGVVIQRGAKNYAGPHCPGAMWNCTTARRVAQVSTLAAASNVYTCTGTPNATNSCVITQSAASGQNVAVCTQDESNAGSPDSQSQSCKITQTSTTGKNTATVLQKIRQGPSCTGTTGQTQSGSQDATVTQQNKSGPNNASVTQSAAQCATTTTTGAASQSQATSQMFQIEQGGANFNPGNPSSCPNMTGSNSASANQSQQQSGSATSAASGSQTQNADLNGHIDQCSNSNSSYTAAQTENQSLAPNVNVSQTQIGPTSFGRAVGGTAARGRTLQKSICCSFQGINPSDTCTITQTTTQTAQKTALQIEDLTAQGTSTGTCASSISSTQVDAQTGLAETNTASSSGGHDAGARLLCQNTVCSNTPIPTAIAYSGDTSGVYSDTSTYTATLTRSDTNAPLFGEVISFQVGGQPACSALTDSLGVATCSSTISLKPLGSYQVSASFAGSGPFLPSSSTPTGFSVAKETALLTYTGATSGQYGDSATLSATLVDNDGQALSDPSLSGGPSVGFTLGTLSCSHAASPTSASCPVTLSLNVGSYDLGSSFAGDDYYTNASTSSSGGFTVNPEVATLSFTTQPPAYVPRGGTVNLAAGGTDDDLPTGNAVPSGTPIVFNVGGTPCSATVGTTATCSVPSSANGQVTITVDFASGGNFVSSHGPVGSDPTPTTFTPLVVGGSAFVLGDKANLNQTVTFWGSQWASKNPMSGSGPPSSFKGFAQTLGIATCGSPSTGNAWTTSPAASPPLPSAFPVGSYAAMVLASSIVSGPNSSIIATTVPKVVVVRVVSYSTTVGGSGTGTVVQTLC